MTAGSAGLFQRGRRSIDTKPVAPATLELSRHLVDPATGFGVDPIAGNLGERPQDERSLGHPGVRDVEVRFGDDPVPVEEKIEVELPSSEACSPRLPARLTLDPLQRRKQFARPERGRSNAAGVQKVRLFRNVHRGGFIHGGTREALNERSERGNAGPEPSQAIAEVRADADRHTAAARDGLWSRGMAHGGIKENGSL
jgi:hypothetical protein